MENRERRIPLRFEVMDVVFRELQDIYQAVVRFRNPYIAAVVYVQAEDHNTHW